MIFPGFPVFPVQEIDHFSCFPAGNSNTRKCATLIAMYKVFVLTKVQKYQLNVITLRYKPRKEQFTEESLS